MATEVPTGNTIEVVLDRMKRASNFASNGAYIAGANDPDPIDTAELYIRAAQSMLDEARETIAAIKAGA